MEYLRLKKEKSISATLKKGKRLHAETLTMVFLPAERTYLAVCVGKKYGKSVRRNHIKRLLREAFRGYAQKMSPCRVLLIPHLAEKYDYHAFSRDIGKMLKKEGLLHEQTS